MLWCKVAGGALLLSCGVLWGALSAGLVRHRLRQTEAFFALLSVLRGQIDRHDTPLRAALRALDVNLLADCGIGERVETPLALLRATPLYLPREAAEALRSFASSAEGVPKAVLLRRCDETAEQLRRCGETQRRALPREERVAFFLPLAAMIAVALLLC